MPKIYLLLEEMAKNKNKKSFFYYLKNFIFLLRVFITKSFLMENLLLLPPLTFLIIKVGFGGNFLKRGFGRPKCFASGSLGGRTGLARGAEENLAAVEVLA
jgi:hypothetical protein